MKDAILIHITIDGKVVQRLTASDFMNHLKKYGYPRNSSLSDLIKKYNSDQNGFQKAEMVLNKNETMSKAKTVINLIVL